jgi:ABC-type branched-subunit amino acid transport system ATPase component
MLNTIHLQGFKGFKDTRIGPLRKVNLIVGGQNVGKTSVLEAVYAVTQPDAGARLARAFRLVQDGDEGRYLDSVFTKNFRRLSVTDDEMEYLLSMTMPDRDQRFCQMEGIGKAKFFWRFLKDQKDHYSGMNPMVFSVYLPTQEELVNTLGRVTLERKKKDLLAILQQVEPRLEDLNNASPDGEHRIYVDLAGIAKALPLPQLGHGFSRLLSLFAEMVSNDSKLALIDEVENGIHYSALPTLFSGIKAITQKQGVQSIITTHSWDCLRAACEVFADSPDLFQVIRLERHGDDIQAVCIDGERMQRLMADDREVR